MSFSSPYLLLTLLALPLLLAVALWLDRRRSQYSVAFTNLDLLASVVSTRRSWRRWVPLALLVLALAAATTAAARPQAVESVPAQQATIVLLVDVSGSMRANDVKPTRLGAAQAAMASFLGSVPSRVKVGLVSFSTEPDVLVPPTTDRQQMREGLSLLVPEAGTAIGDGLSVAVHVATSSLGQAPRGPDGKLPGAIVLLSDGAQTRGALSPLQGAALARTAGLRVFTIALGTSHGAVDLGPGGGLGQGGRFPVLPNPAVLRQISDMTGGSSFEADSGSKVHAIYRHLGSSIAHHQKKTEISSWFAGAAAFLLLGSFGVGRLTAERLP